MGLGGFAFILLFLCIIGLISSGYLVTAFILGLLSVPLAIGVDILTKI